MLRGRVVLDKDRNFLNVKHLPQSLDKAVKKRIKRGRSRKRLAKIEKPLPQVVALAVKEPLDPLLEEFLERFA